jgi:hypothetical protein
VGVRVEKGTRGRVRVGVRMLDGGVGLEGIAGIMGWLTS